MWVGVATHKNTLGVLALVGAIFLLWDLLDLKRKSEKGVGKYLTISKVVVLLLCWYLLVIANSATSLVCAILGSSMLLILNLPSVSQGFRRVEAFGLWGIALFVTLDSLFNVKELVVTDLLGRDMTLTTRTDVWPILLTYQDNPLVGAGFNSFWAGERLVKLFESVGGIIQAHNGYIETYLNGGFVGVGLLLVVLLATYLRIRKRLLLQLSDANIRLVVLTLAVIYNNSEASFNKVGMMWFVTLYALMEYRAQLHPATPLVRIQ
ncbi:MAG: O-antigen ligase family protein [Nitrospira sp.]